MPAAIARSHRKQWRMPSEENAQANSDRGAYIYIPIKWKNSRTRGVSEWISICFELSSGNSNQNASSFRSKFETDRDIPRHSGALDFRRFDSNRQTDRQTDRQTAGRQTETDRQTNRETDRQPASQTDRQPARQAGDRLCAGLCGWSCPPLVLVLAAPLNSVAGLCGPAYWRGVWPNK